MRHDPYTERILGYVEGKRPLDVLASTPETLERFISGASPAELRERPAREKWSVNEIVAHLADGEIVGAFRMRFVLGAPGSPVVAYNQDEWVTSGHYDQRDATTSVGLFRMLREANLALLRSLTPAQWKHYGVHSERGQESIEDMVRMFAGHDINHLQQIEHILARG